MPPSVRKRGRWVPPAAFSVVSLDKAGSWVAEASVVLWGDQGAGDRRRTLGNSQVAQWWAGSRKRKTPSRSVRVGGLLKAVSRG